MSIDKNTGPGGIGASYGQRTTLVSRDYDVDKTYGDTFKPGGDGSIDGVDAASYRFREAGGVVAAYYYGEWTTPGVSYRPSPWGALQPYADRLPVLAQKISAGVYGMGGDDAAAVLWEQEQALAAGVDVFVHNVYWFDPDGGTNYRNMCHASLDQHAVCPTDHKFCIQYSNHGVSPVSTPAQFNAMIEYWFQFINGAPGKYWKINGKPVIYIYDTQEFQRMASVVFSLANTQVAMTQALASMKAHAAVFGIPGLFIVSQSASDSPYWIGNKYGHIGAIDASGLDAATRYNRLWTYTDRWQTIEGVGADYDTRFPQPLTSFDQLAEVYRNADNWIVNESGSELPFFVPAICGWDRRPWKEDGSHGLDAVSSEDNCAASPEQWLQHLRTQRGFAMSGTRGATGVPPVVNMYAWNEYGEGGFLCPSRRYGWDLVRKVREVFGDSPLKPEV